MPIASLGRKPPPEVNVGDATTLTQSIVCEVMIAGATLNPGAKVARSPKDPHECIPATDEDATDPDDDDAPAHPPPEVIGVVDPFLRDDVPINAGDLVWVLLHPTKEVSGNLYTRGEYDRVWMDEAATIESRMDPAAVERLRNELVSSYATAVPLSPNATQTTLRPHRNDGADASLYAAQTQAYANPSGAAQEAHASRSATLLEHIRQSGLMLDRNHTTVNRRPPNPWDDWPPAGLSNTTRTNDPPSQVRITTGRQEEAQRWLTSACAQLGVPFSALVECMTSDATRTHCPGITTDRHGGVALHGRGFLEGMSFRAIAAQLWHQMEIYTGNTFDATHRARVEFVWT